MLKDKKSIFNICHKEKKRNFVNKFLFTSIFLQSQLLYEDIDSDEIILSSKLLLTK